MLYALHYNYLVMYSLLQLGWQVGQNHFPFGLFLIFKHFMWNRLVSQLIFLDPVIAPPFTVLQ